MKAVIFALLLTLGSLSSATITVTDVPKTDPSSCDTSASPALYYVWIEAKSSGLATKATFDLKLEKPSGAVAACSVCADTDTGSECGYITCTIDTKKYSIKKTDIVLPGTAPSLADVSIVGWDKVSGSPTAAKDVTCFSNYLKIGALLFVSLFLF